MKTVLALLAFLAVLASTRVAGATTWYVSPTGTAASGCTTRSTPCDLTDAAAGAMAGDTVILMDGVYKTQLVVANSGTSSAWITFQADTCATPIIQGPGVGPTDTNQDTGVGSSTATYVRFVGIVSTGWSAGFANGWTGTDTTTSNGNFEYDDCIADFNGRTGITFFSASGIKVKNCIVAHNGSSTAESWSSGITLYEAKGGAGSSTIEGNVSFENMDGQNHTDGSGFIIDEYSDGATFINNVAFRNAGSCLRLTKSMNCKFINNTCYHNAQDTQDTGPTNPGEVYFTKDSSNSTTTGTSFLNNVFVATGTGPGATAIYNQPTAGWSNNQTSTGSVSFFTSPDGTNPDFTLASGSALVGKGGTGSGVPANDIGFDPKCITKKTPTPPGTMAKGSWWQYSVDLAYVQSIGGVAGCFHAKARSGTPDIGAYANGTVTKAGTCTPPAPGTGGTSGTAGNNGTGGTTGTAGANGTGGTTGTAGAKGTGGSGNGGTTGGAGGHAGAAATGNGGGSGGAGSGGNGSGTGGSTGTGTGGATVGAGGTNGSGGSGVGSGGIVGTGTGGNGAGGTASGTGGVSTSTGGSVGNPSGTGGSGTSATGGASGDNGASSGSSSGCACGVVGGSSESPVGLCALGLGLFMLRRRRRSR
jgi:MYXO-CTERM domain-containing protein